jgi:hypothetical protein
VRGCTSYTRRSAQLPAWVGPELEDVAQQYGVRELTPKCLTRLRADLEKAGVGTVTVVKAMTIVQSILSFAVGEELVEYNAAAGVTKPRYERAREPRIFLPQLRDPPDLRRDPAHTDRPRGWYERPNDRAALRRRDRQVGRKTSPSCKCR